MKSSTNKISESIFDGKKIIVPMADVQHIEKADGGIMIITDKTKWNFEKDCWENNIWISDHNGQAQEFISAWCIYRHELEGLDG